jgi:predicted transcriptional regulator
MNHLIDIQIKDAAPHIFRRPVLFVQSNTRMLQIATFLAIGPQIYVDGVIVIDDDKVQRGRPVGRISSKHIISNILSSADWFRTTASQIMDGFVMPLEIDSPLKRALEVFEKTRFGFIPILTRKNDRMEDEEGDSFVVTASLAIRDILPLIAKANLSTPIKELSSLLISVDSKTSVRDALNYMMNKSIRNIGIKESANDDSGGVSSTKSSRKSKLSRVINDRKILEFLLSHNGREVLRKNGIAGLAYININNNLDIISPTTVKSNTTVSNAAELLTDVRNPCLILEGNEKEDGHNYIVTPFDIVMKTLKSNHIVGG